MRASGTTAPDRLQAALVLQRRGAADELRAIHDLVVDYGIDVDDDLTDELMVSTVRGGGDGTPDVHEFVHLELCGLCRAELESQALRAKALGIMATPALALALQQQALQPELLNDDETTAASVINPDTGRIDRDPHHCVGHACGSVTVAPGKLAPKAKVYLHIDATDLTALGGCRLDREGRLDFLAVVEDHPA